MQSPVRTCQNIPQSHHQSHSAHLALGWILMVFCIGYNTRDLPAESSRLCNDAIPPLEESMTVVAVECLDLGRSLCHNHSRLRLGSEELSDGRVWLAPDTPGTPDPSDPYIPGTPGTPPWVIATNPCGATAGMELEHHSMIRQNSCPPVPDDHRRSSSVVADLWMLLRPSHARECLWPAHVNSRTHTTVMKISTYRHVGTRR